MRINTARIKVKMGEKLLTQEGLAKESGVSRATINCLLLKGSCSTSTVGKIAKALGVDPAEIVAVEE